MFRQKLSLAFSCANSCMVFCSVTFLVFDGFGHRSVEGGVHLLDEREFALILFFFVWLNVDEEKRASMTFFSVVCPLEGKSDCAFSYLSSLPFLWWTSNSYSERRGLKRIVTPNRSVMSINYRRQFRFVKTSNFSLIKYGRQVLVQYTTAMHSLSGTD